MPNCGLGTRHPDDPVRVQYFASYFIRFASRQIRMSHRVIGNLVSVRDHSLDQLRVVLYVRTDDAERCWHPVFCQHIEDVRCAKWIRAVVKRQVDVATSGAIVALVARLGYAIEDLHRSGPFRSIIEPVGGSTVDRPIRKAATGTVSVSLGGVSRDTSESVGIMETYLNLSYYLGL
ncbi:hypothetical protein B0G75_12964 [Paraburkholderia sp. BL18I3N2]|nr:hypothetical protein B0G75_12964 [Paraburkholderia sp. BL18I3N2]PRX92638.1 hypothetical protein B0G73_13464 [Paraburkholderia sp. BL25I1N1]